MRIGRRSEPRFVFVCQLVEVIGEADDNVTFGEDGLVWPGSLVGEYQLRIPKWDPISNSPIGCISYMSSLSTTSSDVH